MYSHCRYKLQGATAIYDASIDHFDVQLIPSDGVTTINYSVMSCLSIRPLTALGRLRRQCSAAAYVESAEPLPAESA